MRVPICRTAAPNAWSLRAAAFSPLARSLESTPSSTYALPALTAEVVAMCYSPPFTLLTQWLGSLGSSFSSAGPMNGRG